MFDFLKKKPKTLEEEMLILIYHYYPVSLDDIKYIHKNTKSFDRTINVLEYSLEYNLSIESAVNVLS